MQTISDAFKKALSANHRVYHRVEMYPQGILVPQAMFELPITDGSVTIDDVAIRRRATIRFTEGDTDIGTIVPGIESPVLNPLTCDFRIYRGVYTSLTQHEEVPVITGRMADVRIDDSGDGFTMAADIYDWARRVSRAKFVREYKIVAGTNYADAIQTMLANRVNGLEFNFVSTTYTTPLLVFQTGWDPWEQAQKMARSIGCDLYFDPMGICTMTTIPNLIETPPVWAFEEGPGEFDVQIKAMLLYLMKRRMDEHTYNYVVVTGETISSAAPVRGEAFDDNPSSPTYYLGPMGTVVKTLLGQTGITTAAQASQAAFAELAKGVGATEMLEVTGLVNPALDLNDVIAIRREKSQVFQNYVTDKLTIPLTHARGMNLSTRVQVVAE